MRILAAVLFACSTTLASWAQAQDLPIRVGRIAHIEGQASLYQDPEAGWERAYINSPITSENSVWTDDGSRAEVRVSGMAIRLDHLTQLDVARLDEDELDAYVARGSVAVRVRHYENNERLVFNTPNARVRLRANGRYRIDVDPERLETRITVFTGEARVGTEDGRTRIGAGHSMVVFGVDPPGFVEERVMTGAFDRWTLARDERWREGRAPTYVSTYMTGYEDLDAYGQWVTEPDYGVLWYPRQVAADWAPYRYGHWDYVHPWGWTWIDDAPWGYAPFHYGRWVYVRDRWGWVPGERVARPVWAPALVAWIGGSNWSVGVSSGPSLGWYPLSPWDRYDPWFQASPTYVQRVNLIVRAEPTRADRRQWRQWTRERGLTVVDRRAVIEQQPVQRSVRRLSNDVIRQVEAVQRPETVLPTRNEVIQRRRERPQQVAAPRVIAQAPAPTGATAPAPTQPSAIVRPSFGRNAVAATPRQSSEQERQAQRPQAQRQAQERLAREQQQAQQLARERQAREQQRNPLERGQRDQQQAQERAQREQQQAQERQAREQQQAQERAQREQQQGQRQQQERAQREQQQAQERQAREQQQAQRQAQERAQREQQQAQERQAREQQQAQRQQQERAQREQQQTQERQAREQQQAQRQAQERAQREQQQAQERQAREQQQAQRQAQERAQREQQQAQRQAQERAQREQQQAQERQAREQQQAQRQAQERAQREQQQAQRQAQERAQREQQQAQERQAAQQAQAQAQAQQAQGQSKGKGRDKDEDEEKGKGKNR